MGFFVIPTGIIAAGFTHVINQKAEDDSAPSDSPAVSASCNLSEEELAALESILAKLKKSKSADMD